MVARNIIVIGASAGGFEALQRLVAGFTPDLHAAVFITQHQAPRSEGVLPEILNRVGPLQATHPWEETEIEMGRIYVAPPDYHLTLTETSVMVERGPKENMQRPCINRMFRSAAQAHGPKVAGVLLTGLLDDGAAGLWEIQQKGGATIVQDPEEAAYRSMPENAIRGLNVQYIVRLAEMAPLLLRLTMGKLKSATETVSAEWVDAAMSQVCPECNGVMTMHHMGRIIEYQCHTGHRLGLKTMIAEKSSLVERTMWSAMAQSEELVALLQQALGAMDEAAAAPLHEEIAQRKLEQKTLKAIIERERAPSISS